MRFLDIWWFSGWILAKLALIRSKMRLQHNSLPFLPLAWEFSTLLLGHAQKVTYVFRLFDFWTCFFHLFFFSFSFLFAAVIALLLGLLAVKKLLRKRHRERQFLAWSSRQVQWQEILLWVFHSIFLAFLCISQAPSLWSGHHWLQRFFSSYRSWV